VSGDILAARKNIVVLIRGEQENRENWKKITKKPNREKNRLENHKIFPVRFGFGFQSRKPIEPNRPGSTKLALEKKRV